MGWLAVPLTLIAKLPEYMPSAMVIVWPGTAAARAARRPSVVETVMSFVGLTDVDGPTELGGPDVGAPVVPGPGDVIVGVVVPLPTGSRKPGVPGEPSLNGKSTCG